jgi:gliding motility-associated-like protein
MKSSFLFVLLFNLSFCYGSILSFKKINIDFSNVKSTDSIIKKRESILTTNSDCTENFNLFNEEDKENYTYNAEQTISTEGNYKIISSNNEIRMKAGNTIIIKPNTYIKKGSLYLARIENCERENCENTTIPKGISPDNNNINDYLDLSEGCPIKLLKIFNRYGINVYEKKDYSNEWTGKDNSGNELPSATYFYFIQYESGKQKTGWIYLNY